MQDKKIDQLAAEYLEAFDGNVSEAILAIRKSSVDANKKVTTRTQYDPTGPVLIKIRDLAKTYKIGRQEVTALNGISFDVHQGEFLAITGSSGSGKSTLLQLMGGLDKASGGSVMINGVNLNKMNDRKLSDFRSQTIGFVFQFFYLQPFLRLARNIELPGVPRRTKRHERQQRIIKLASEVGLSEQINHLPKELSGGQIQRAAIARALFNNPKVILADEPTGNLDSANSKAIIDLFENIRQQQGTTIVVVTHDPAVANRADRIITMQDGVMK